MAKLQTIPLWLVKSSVLFCYLLISLPVTAQIVPDSTLPVNSSVTTQDNVSNITGGTVAGGNLFHSFDQFSVLTGREANFNNALDIQNIISRVTGASVSNIDGLLRANGTANLFLLNPNGIIFGANARLSIGGSFVGSTASSLNFADGTQFSATSPQTTPLLTVSVPIGLGFASNPGRIGVQGNGQGRRTTRDLIDTSVGLRVEPNATLALVGGNVTLEGGTLKTTGGRIELGSVGGPSLIGLTSIDKGWALSYEGVQNFQDVQLLQQATVDASGAGGGDVQVRGKRVTLADSSQIEVSTLGSQAGGTLAVTSSESVELSGYIENPYIENAYYGLLAQVYEGATGTGGDISIVTGKLIARDGGKVLTETNDEGSAGNIFVNASDSVELIGTSTDGSFASELISFTGGSGDAGDVSIVTGRLIARDGARLTTATSGEGRGGNLSVNASDSVELSGTTPDGSFASRLISSTGGSGDAGDISIVTRKLSARDGTDVATGTLGEGRGGNLFVNASDLVELSGTTPDGRFGSGLISSTNGTGDAGDLSVVTGRLIARDGGVVSAGTTRAEGKGGNLSVNASDLVELSGTTPDGRFGSGLYSRTRSTGAAGDLSVVTKKLVVRDGAQVTVSSISQGINPGRAGRVGIIARSINLDNQGTITAETSSGEGGNIALQVWDALLLRRNSQISTEARGTGNGGNITIGTSILAALENSDITANAFEGQGGNIQITTQGLFRSPDSDITASSQLGINGTVEINTPDVDPSQGLVNLPEELVDASNQIAQSCPVGVGSTASKFVITSRGGIPNNPNETLSKDTIWTDLRPTFDSAQERPSSSPVSTQSNNPTEIVEANGWMINSKGEVILTASPRLTLDIPWIHPSGCHAS